MSKKIIKLIILMLLLSCSKNKQKSKQENGKKINKVINNKISQKKKKPKQKFLSCKNINMNFKINFPIQKKKEMCIVANKLRKQAYCGCKSKNKECCYQLSKLFRYPEDESNWKEKKKFLNYSCKIGYKFACVSKLFEELDDLKRKFTTDYTKPGYKKIVEKFKTKIYMERLIVFKKHEKQLQNECFINNENDACSLYGMQISNLLSHKNYKILLKKNGLDEIKLKKDDLKAMNLKCLKISSQDHNICAGYASTLLEYFPTIKNKKKVVRFLKKACDKDLRNSMYCKETWKVMEELGYSISDVLKYKVRACVRETCVDEWKICNDGYYFDKKGKKQKITKKMKEHCSLDYEKETKNFNCDLRPLKEINCKEKSKPYVNKSNTNQGIIIPKKRIEKAQDILNRIE
jgi:hypothetical protein